MAVTTPTPPYQPRNEIYVCSGVGFDGTFQHTRFFQNLDARLTYFRSKAIAHFENITPIRIYEGYVKLENPPDFYYHADYIVFRNTDFDNGKWYFAFLDQPAEMKAMNTSGLRFKIDPIQTWLDNAIFGLNYMERIHWPSDDIGDNLVPDNLELGDYIVNDATQTNLFDDYSIIIASTVEKSGGPSTPGYYGGIYSGLSLLKFDSATEANDHIKQMESDNKRDSIISIFMMPTEFFSPKSTSSASRPIEKSFTYQAPQRNTVDGYTPRNKKLLTHPYKMLQVSNLSGNSAEYHYEYFPNQVTPGFVIVCDTSPNPTVKLIPTSYNGYGNGRDPIDYGLTLNGFPQCAWVSDSYLAWLAQSGSVSALGMNFTGQDLAFAQQGLGAAGNLLSGNIGGALSSFLGIAQNVAKVNATKSLPPQAGGQTANGAMVAFRAKDFLFSDLSVRAEFARIIDDYWTKYGYPCHELRQMNFISRPSFNFIKTQGCKVRGNIPQWARIEIQNIFDSGITLWHTDDIGNYNLPNNP